MTREELDAFIDETITNKTEDDSISPQNEGDALKKVADYAEGLRGYKRIIFDLAISGGTVTPTYHENDFEGETLEWSNPSNGKIRLTGDSESTWNVPGKTLIKDFIFNNSGSPYFAAGSYNLLGSPTYILDINLIKYDGTQTGTPSTTLRRVEIRVYP